VVVGGAGSVGATLASTLLALPPGWVGVLLARPAAVTVPAAFLTMVLVSLRTRDEVPADVDRTLLRLHAPERLGLTPDRRREGGAGPVVG
jgi:Na+(H+)/acetate symporter ActP